MKIIQVVQGTPEWLKIRAPLRCASDAPVMMGESTNLSRSELVRMKATGDSREFSDWVLANVIDKGHEVEALARVHAEREMGEDLYPVTAISDDGVHLASFDGLTMAAEDSWESKQWNEALAAAVRAKSTTLPGGLHWQLEHQLLVGAPSLKRVRFTVSDGTAEKREEMIYEAVPGRREQLLRGWAQFEEDVANYQHVEVLPRAVAEPQAELPVPSIEVTGDVAIKSNLTNLAEQLRAYIEKIPEAPATDQEFANCEAACKALKLAEERLELAESSALAKFSSIDEMRGAIATMKAYARETRLATEKLVDARKKTIRVEILQEGQRAYASHLEKLNARIGTALLNDCTVARPDFAGAMKGKKTITSLRSAVSDTLAAGKIAANEIADRVEANVKHVVAQGPEYKALFMDLAQLAFREADYVQLIVRTRIEEHKAAVQKQADAAAEKAREAIAAEERAKLEAAERAKNVPTATVAPAPLATLASVPAPAAVAPAGGRAPPMPRPRPTDDEIIAALALHYRVHESIVIAWLLEMDLKAASTRMASEFAA